MKTPSKERIDTSNVTALREIPRTTARGDGRLIWCDEDIGLMRLREGRRSDIRRVADLIVDEFQGPFSWLQLLAGRRAGAVALFSLGINENLFSSRSSSATPSVSNPIPLQPNRDRFGSRPSPLPPSDLRRHHVLLVIDEERTRAAQWIKEVVTGRRPEGKDVIRRGVPEPPLLGCIELGLAERPNLEGGREMSWREVLELTIRSPGHGQTTQSFFTTIDNPSQPAWTQVLGEEEPDALDERVTVLERGDSGMGWRMIDNKTLGKVQRELNEMGITRSKKYLAYFANLAVAPHARRKGLGTLLLDECERYARQWGYDGLWLCVERSNRSGRSLYVRQGYRLKAVEVIKRPHSKRVTLGGLFYEKKISKRRPIKGEHRHDDDGGEKESILEAVGNVPLAKEALMGVSWSLRPMSKEDQQQQKQQQQTVGNKEGGNK